jgi:hypothetical protein
METIVISVKFVPDSGYSNTVAHMYIILSQNVFVVDGRDGTTFMPLQKDLELTVC